MVRSAGHATRPAPAVPAVRLLAGIVSVVVSVVLAGCATGDGRTLAPALHPPPPPPTTAPHATTAAPVLALLAPWADGAPIPADARCGTDAVAPALTWFGVADATVELLLTIQVDGEHRDALIGIPPTATGLGADALPTGAFWWPPSDVGRRWPGVCEGDDVTFTLYALNQQLEAADDADVAEVASIAELTALAHDTVTGSVTEPATTSSP